jgi:hypothetical protein
MNTTALILMVSTMTLVSAITLYFFVRVLRAPAKPEPDSFKDNDEDR